MVTDKIKTTPQKPCKDTEHSTKMNKTPSKTMGAKSPNKSLKSPSTNSKTPSKTDAKSPIKNVNKAVKTASKSPSSKEKTSDCTNQTPTKGNQSKTEEKTLKKSPTSEENTSLVKSESKRRRRRDGNTHFPMTRVRTIMKTARDAVNVSPDAVVLVGKAAELFVSELVLKTYQDIKFNKKKIGYSDLATYVNKESNEDTLGFLHELIPHKISVAEYKRLISTRKDVSFVETISSSSEEEEDSSEEESGEEEEEVEIVKLSSSSPESVRKQEVNTKKTQETNLKKKQIDDKKRKGLTPSSSKSPSKPVETVDLSSDEEEEDSDGDIVML